MFYIRTVNWDSCLPHVLFCWRKVNYFKYMSHSQSDIYFYRIVDTKNKTSYDNNWNHHLQQTSSYLAFSLSTKYYQVCVCLIRDDVRLIDPVGLVPSDKTTSPYTSLSLTNILIIVWLEADIYWSVLSADIRSHIRSTEGSVITVGLRQRCLCVHVHMQMFLFKELLLL